MNADSYGSVSSMTLPILNVNIYSKVIQTDRETDCRMAHVTVVRLANCTLIDISLFGEYLCGLGYIGWSIIIIIIVCFMHGIHTQIPQTNHIPRGYIVKAIL